MSTHVHLQILLRVESFVATGAGVNRIGIFGMAAHVALEEHLPGKQDRYSYSNRFKKEQV